MTSPICLDAISKSYRIFQNPQDRFKQALLDRFQGLVGRRNASPLYREHWALRDVSFQLEPGEAVGILGRNGAGKSTLLQIIAGTLEPTSGRIQTRGRITALLELGSGFNPEFTGRENVFLNAQILGMARSEVQERFDGIASFADIGDFIDQPVKTYSSGMMMRVAFAVQTAIEPKVLIVDEALSVGDMFFQAKCMARIRRLVDDGVAILFVSHDVGAVRQLCGRAIMLESGCVKAIGETKLVTDQYVKRELEDRNRTAADRKTSDVSVLEAASQHAMASANTDDMLIGKAIFDEKARRDRMGNGWARIENVQMLRGDSGCSTGFDFNEEVTVKVHVHFLRALSNVNVSLRVRTLQGTDLIFWDSRLQGEFGNSYDAQTSYVFAWKFELPLMHGNYALAVGIACPPERAGDDWLFIDMVPHAYDFQVRPRQEGMIGGYVALPARLEVIRVPGSVMALG